MNRLRGLVLVLSAAAASIAVAACRGNRATPPPPVILISIDTLRADHLPAYGYRGVATPALDSLRKDSILYANAYAQVPLTLPSHASLLTGLPPYENGVRDNVGFRLDPSHPTIAALLRASGYATGAAVSTYALRRDRGLAAGFDLYDDELAPDSPDERAGAVTAERLERWIDSARSGVHRERPVFALLHIYEPHAPYAPPEPFRTRYASQPYDGEIATADAAVGGFLAFLKERRLYDAALIVFLSDHGEGLNDHGEEEHGVFLYRETIRVPLFVKLPKNERAGETVDRPVALVDVVPTIATVARAAKAPRVSGVSLLERAPAGAPERRIYSETLYPRLQLQWSDLASLTDARYQYVEAPRPELYDLAADPGERHDLAAGRPPAMRSMRAALESIRRAIPSPEKSSPEELAKLGSLGYISVARGPSAGPLPDPKDRVATLAKYKRLFALFYARRDSEVLELAREILQQDPGILSVSRMLAASLERLHRPGDAADVLERALDRENPGGTPEDLAQAYGQLATALEKSGDAGRAEKALRRAIDRGIADEEIRRRLARRLVETKRADEALALLPETSSSGSPPDAEETLLRAASLAAAGRTGDARAALESLAAREPGNAAALYQLGMLSLRENDSASARRWLERARAADPSSAPTLTALGLAQAASGDSQAALESWTRALELDPGQHRALFNRSILVGRLGNAAEARRGLERFLATAPETEFSREREEAKRLIRSLESRRAS